jgi:hypothetical protein
MATKRRTADTASESTVETNSPENMSEVIAEATDSKKRSAKTRESGTRLTGQELLAYTDTNATAGKTAEELALGAGYFTKITDTETGETKTNIQTQEYYKVVAETSRGITIAPSKRVYAPRRNRAQAITVGGTGNCVVGVRYTAQAGYEPGSKVSVVVEGNRVILSPFVESEGADEDQSESEDMDL